jgi:hypothetical protein
MENRVYRIRRPESDKDDYAHQVRCVLSMRKRFESIGEPYPLKGDIRREYLYFRKKGLFPTRKEAEHAASSITTNPTSGANT